MKMTQEVLHELISYSPDSGDFVWKEREPKWFTSEPHCRAWNTKYANKVAGFVCSHTNTGYQKINIRIFGKLWAGHRLAWLWMTGAMPSGHIDHIDRDGKNNRWHNLRDVTPTENRRNSSIRKDNTSGYSGVVWCKRRCCWIAKGYTSGKRRHLGYFDDVHNAGRVVAAFNRAHGYMEGHGTCQPHYRAK